MMLWGKWTGGFYPLEAHLIDTAAFARVLCEQWLPVAQLERAAELLQVDTSQVVDLVVAAGGLHDIGKATSIFQRQNLAQRQPHGLDEHAKFLDRSGLVSPPGSTLLTLDDESRRWVRRHEVAGAVWIHRDGTDAGGSGLAALVAGHHGLWDVPDETCGYHHWMLNDPAWEAARERIASTVLSASGTSAGLGTGVANATVVPLLTGLVVLADWLASDLADRDRTYPDDADWTGHHARRVDQAAEAIQDLLGSVVKPRGTFHDVFGFAPDRPVQQALVRRAGHGLRLVAVPTGEGKTEAALGHWLQNSADKQGLFFALPSMATADAMFARVQGMFASAESIGALAHGHALLNEFYDLPDRHVRPETHDGCGGLTPSRWLSGRGRAVLAPVTVGTADQVLLSVVRHRHNFLRTLGTAGKTVVFDEVHSYDPYMSTLLERFLRWAGHWGTDVVLLSATIPQERARAYVAAYGGNLDRVEVRYPSITTVDAVNGDTATVEIEAPTSARTLEFVPHLTDDSAAETIRLVRMLREHWPDAKIGVIVNTVGRCQQVAAALAGRRDAKDCPHERLPGALHVMHSRFTAQRRAAQTEEAVAAFGKSSASGAATLVATQVVEQSVDLDFDVMVTDLCPAPSLVQRAGRVQRHDVNGRTRAAARVRPDGCDTPIIHLVVPTTVDTNEVRPTALLPYPAGSVVQTWRAGLDRGQMTRLRVPDEVQAFVDRSHLHPSELFAEDGVSAEDEDELFGRLAKNHEARNAAIPDPDGLRDDPVGCLHHYARLEAGRPQTRWIEHASFELLPVDGDAPDAWHGELPNRPTVEQIRQVLGHAISISFDPRVKLSIAFESRDDSLTTSWEGTALEGLQIIDMTHPDRPFDLDELLGLVQR